ncbi:MAG: NADH-quinone oxidoreductase subunit J [Planctomycetota bacterium]|nr:NADH-quinone oxidoreductase subunit J [Planctomycetota bacterium]
MTVALFLIFGATALASALLSVTRKNPVASAMWLVLMFFGLAGNYVLLEAYFVAAVQILVYAGAIMVLFLFVIMLLDLRREQLESEPQPRLPFFGVAAAVLFIAVAAIALLDAVDAGVFPDAAARSTLELDGSAKAIGESLFGTWVLAFEVTGFLLLGAILGAVILTKRRLT